MNQRHEPSDAKTCAMSRGDARVFSALADTTRRQLLDALYLRDGQRPSELSMRFEVSRQAILRHLGLLESAGLVVAERTSSETFYHLNRAPLQRIHSQWLAKFTGHSPRVDCG